MSHSKTLDHAAEQVSFIFATLFPEETVDIHLGFGDPCKFSPVFDNGCGDFYLPHQFFELQDRTVRTHQPNGVRDRRGTERKCAFVCVPAEGLAAPLVQLSQSRKSKVLRSVTAKFPIIGEYLKYVVERRRFNKLSTRHLFRPLPCKNASAGADKGNVAPAVKASQPAIIIGLHWLDVGGAETLGVQSIRWALDVGLRVFVVLDKLGGEGLADHLPDHKDLTILRTDLYLPKRLASQFIAHLAEQQNVILTHNHHCGIIYDALPMLKALQPDVVHLDSTHIIEYINGGYPRTSGVWSNFIDHHHVVSDDLANFYTKHFGIDEKKLHLGRLLSPNLAEPATAPRLKAGAKTCRVAFVGRLVHQKRPSLVLEIFKRLQRWGKKNGVEFIFDIVGEGPHETSITALAVKMGLKQSITFHSAQTDVPALLGKSDVMVLPSANEGLALVCYEAIQAGCIAISSDVGGQREICGEQGLVPWQPFRTVFQTVKVITNMLSKEGVAQAVFSEELSNLKRLQEEPLAEDVIKNLYQKSKDLAETL